MRLLAALFFTIILGSAYCQNYIEYQKVFNRIDEDILSDNHPIAIQRLDSILNTYEFIFADHCIKALQICCYLDDSINANKWLAKSFTQGVPLWIIRTNELTNRSLNYNTTQQTIEKYDSLYRIYKSSINSTLAKQIDSLMVIDQKYTERVNDGFIPFRHTIYGLMWLRNNKKQFIILNEIIDKHGFPGERLIGLSDGFEDSAAAAKNLIYYGPTVGESSAYIMLIHHYSWPRKDINDKLYQNIINGYIPAYQYGALNDFMATFGKKKYGDYQYYNVWHTDKNPENLDSINQRRFAIGLNSYEQQERNGLIWRERRKNKTANKEIIFKR